MQNWWEQDSVAQPAQPQAPRQTGPVYGPAPKGPTELQLAAERRAQADQARQEAQFQTSQQKAALDIQRGQRDLAPGADSTESEKTAAFLATRVAGGISELQNIYGRNSSAASPSLKTEAVRGIFGDTAANYANDSDRQQVEAAQLDILDAALTLGTGAAYTAEQLAGYRKSYFPQLGDTAETIAAKKRRLVTMLEAAKVKAGRSAPMIEQALAAVQGVDEIIEVDVGGEPELVEFETNPNLVVGMDGRIYDKRTGQPVEPDPNDPNSLGQAFYAGVGDVVETAGDFVGLIGNPLNAGINAVAGTDLSTDLGQTFRDAIGAPEGDQFAKAINQGGTSILTGMGAARYAQPLVTGAGEYAVNALLQQPVQQFVGGVSAGAGADLARQAGAPAPVQMAAGFASGLGGFSGTNALMRAAQPKTLSPVAQAAQRQGIDLLPAQTGGTGTRIATAGGRQGFISEIPIAKAVDRQQGQLENVRTRASEAAGVAMDKEDAGELVRKAANIYSKKTGETGAALYTRARQRAAGVTASLDNAIAVIDEELAGIAQAPGGKDTALYKELEGLKKNMAGGKFSIDGIRNMRSTLREEADFKGIRGSNTNRIYNRVVNAASDDMITALRAAGKDDAAAAFKTADDFWKKRVETIDEVLEPLLGKNTQRSGEQILSTLERLGNAETGNAANLRRLMNALPENEARNIRATVIDRLGKPTPGQQTDNTFSLDKFLTDYNKLSGKAKSILFTGESRRALDDLAKIAAADKKAGRFLNTSNTARAVGVQAAVTGGAGLLLNPIVAGLMAGGQFAFGKLLASPKFATWLAKVPANPQAQAAHIKRLDSIAAAEPIIANDIASIKQFLANAPTSARAAAAEGDDVGEERPIKP